MSGASVFLRGNRLIFDDISLTVPRGKITRHHGAVGIGKTTLLRLIGGQIPYPLREHTHLPP